MRLIVLALIAADLLQPFRPAPPYGPGHRGIDVTAPVVVTAPISGWVAFAGQVGGTPTVVIKRGSVKVTLQPVSGGKPAGSWVFRGDALGQVSDQFGYHCQGCLHIGVRHNGEYVNPLTFLNGRLQPVGRGVWIEG